MLIAARAQGAKGYLDSTIQTSLKNTTTKTSTTHGSESQEEEEKVIKEVLIDSGGDENTTKLTLWTSKNPSEEEWDLHDTWTLALIVYNLKNPIGLGIKIDRTAAEV